jgi:tape measure domain-containing protein
MGGATSYATSGMHGLKNALDNVNANGFSSQVNANCKSLLGMNVAAAAVVGTFKALVGQWRHALDVHSELTAAERLLRVATEDGGAAFDWVKHKAYEFGLSVSQVAKQYGVFSATAKETNLTMKEQQDIFESFIQTAAALGMNVQESDRMFYALREILNKNQLRSEELVRQFGNIIPGAVRKAIQAFGQGEEAFRKAMQAGNIRGQVMLDWLKNYAGLLRKDFGGVAREGAESLQGSLGKLKDAVELLYHEVGKGEGFVKLSKAISELGDELREPSTLAQMRSIGSAIGNIGMMIGGTLKFMYDYRSVIADIGVAMAVMKVIKWANDLKTYIATKIISIRTDTQSAYVKWVETAALKAETEARKYNAWAIIQERINSLQLSLETQNALVSTSLMTRRKKEETIARIKNALAIEQEKLRQIETKGAMLGMGVAFNALGGWMTALTIAITAAGAAWGYYKKKKNEALAKDDEEKIKKNEAQKAYSDLLGSMQQELILFKQTNKTQKDIEATTNRIKESIAEYHKQHKGFKVDAELIDIEGKSVNQLIKDVNKLIVKRQENLQSIRDTKKGVLDAKKTEHNAVLENIKDYNARVDAAKKSGFFSFQAAGFSKEAQKLEEDLKKAKKTLDSAQQDFDDIDLQLARFNRQRSDQGGALPPSDDGGSNDKIISMRKFLHELNGQELERRKTLEKITDISTTDLKITKAKVDAELKLAEAAHKHEGALIRILERKDITPKMRTELNKQAELNYANEVFVIRRNLADETQKIYADDRKNREETLKKIAESEESFWDDIESKTEVGISRRYKKIEIWAKEEEKKIQDLIDLYKKLGMSGPINIAGRRAAIQEGVNTQRLEEDERAIQRHAQKIKKTMDKLKKDQGSLSAGDFDKKADEMKAALKGNNDELRLFGEALKDVKAEMRFDGKWYEGIGNGLDEYLKKNSNHFQNFADTTKQIMGDLENAMSDGFSKIFTTGATGAQKWKEIWEGLRNSFIKSIGDLIAKEVAYTTMSTLFSKIRQENAQQEKTVVQQTQMSKIMALLGFGKADAAETVSEVSNSKIRQTEDVTETGTKTAKAASGFFAAHAWIPYVGAALAGGFVALMLAQMAKVKKQKFAYGGEITSPTIALLGEGREGEFAVPRNTFKDLFFDFSQTLADNIMRRQDEANAYREWTTKTVQSASDGGMRDNIIVNHYSIQDKRQLEDVIIGCVDSFNRRM